MCVGVVLQWACGNHIIQWELCNKGHQQDYRPCEWAAEDPSRKVQHNHCCSTSCCQTDIDMRVQTAVEMEHEFRSLLREARREGMTPELRANLRAAEIEVENSEQNMRDSLKYHFYGCVLHVDTKRKLENQERVKNMLAAKLPWELRIPDHREISKKERRQFEKMLDDWERSKFVKSERAFYYDHVARQRHEQHWNEHEKRRQQWQQESRWLDSNLRAVQEYIKSPVRQRYRPILPAGEVPPLFAPGARGSQFPPQREESPSRTSSMDTSGAYSSQPTSRSQSRGSQRSTSQAGSNGRGFNGATPQAGSRIASSGESTNDRTSSRRRSRTVASFKIRTDGESGSHRRR